MAERKFGRIVNITSGSVRAPIAGLDVSSGARAGLTAFLACAARALRARQRDDQLDPAGRLRHRPAALGDRAQRRAARRGVRSGRAGAAARIPAGRFGRPEEFGALCAFLASAQAGFITGQNILIDGGAFPGRVLEPRPSSRTGAAARRAVMLKGNSA